MYTYIDTDCVIEVLSFFLEELKIVGKLPLDFNIEMIMQAVPLLLTWNLCDFGDTYSK